MNKGEIIPQETFYETHIKYYDANSLYASCLTMFLPTGEIEWLKPVYSPTTDDDSTGYIYKVDLEYPNTFHIVQRN